MAGRSGSAAIQLALKEAASGFRASSLAKALRAKGECSIADALDACKEPPELQTVMVMGEPAEYFLKYADGDCARKLDVDPPAAGDEVYGMQVELLADGRVRGVSIFLE